MSRVIGFAIVAVGVYLLFQYFDGMSIFWDRIAVLLSSGKMTEVLWYHVGGVACIIVGLTVAFSSKPD